jgi:hypothetical protein
MNWFGKRLRKPEEKEEQAAVEVYHELDRGEIESACLLGEGGRQSLLAVHLARTMRDEAIVELRNCVSSRMKDTPADIAGTQLRSAAARMDAMCRYEERWKEIFEAHRVARQMETKGKG